MKPNLPKESVVFSPKGETTDRFTPGDFILVSDPTFFGRLISFGQSLRFRGNRLNKWNHAALIVDFDGTLVEADGRRVTVSPLTKYQNSDFYLVKIQASQEDRQEAVRFARSCLDEEYGWATIFSVALSLLTGLRFSFGFDGQEICSGLVARALERTEAIFPRDSSHITPSELAQLYIDSNFERLK